MHGRDGRFVFPGSIAWYRRKNQPLAMETVMDSKMRIMSKRPLNAETPAEWLRSWITANDHFFDRNQGGIPETPVDLDQWHLSIAGEVRRPATIGWRQIEQLPKAIAANTLECSGNSRSLLENKALGNPWTIGGVGNAVWGGVWLRDILALVEPKDTASHVGFEGMDTPLGKSKIKFIRSIPLEKALESTMLAYEMNGEPLPLKHGYPLRALALGWTGANCVKWLNRITLTKAPIKGFFMDNVYRIHQKDQAPEEGAVVTQIALKSIITKPIQDETLPPGQVVVLGAAYAGEARIASVEVAFDGGTEWLPADLIGPDAPFAWRQWQYVWNVTRAGEYKIMARATDGAGRRQPLQAKWNVLGYGNNGIREHAVRVRIDEQCCGPV
jgi:DMSO/TMAO reductase YedYZ molybdopterin-dependent catalytic subunit